MFAPKRWSRFLTDYFSSDTAGERSSVEDVVGDANRTQPADAVLLTSPIARRYLLDFASSAGTVLLFPDAQYFLIDFRYYEQAKAEIMGCDVLLQENLPEQIAQFLAQHGATTCGLEEESVTLADFLRWKEQLTPVQVLADSGVSRLLQRMRRCKDATEIQTIKRAQRITDEVFERICPMIRPGITEREIALEIEYQLKREGADGIAFDTIVAAGTHSSLPHAHPTDTALHIGDFLTMDFGAMLEGYHADMTRTVAVGQVSERQRAVYQTVLEAQQRALAAVKPDVVCAEVDAVARSTIHQAGYEGRFGHGLGHSVGLEIHESPNFSPNSEDRLEVGMVLTVEPGIYLPGEFGVRIEDLVVVTEDGCENLTQSPKKLLVL